MAMGMQAAYASPATDNLELYLKLDETTANGGADSVVDSSGDTNHGTPSGATGTNNTPQPSTDVPSAIDFSNPRSLDFDGTDDIVLLDNPFTGDNFTIALWVNPDVINTGSYQGFIGIQDGDWTYRAPGMWVGVADGSLHYDSYNTSGVRYTGEIAGVFSSANQWVHIAWVKSGSTYDIYKNGTLVVDNASAPAALYRGGTGYQIGGVDNFIDGTLDDVRVYSRALSAVEIGDLADGIHTAATWDGSASGNTETAANWDINAVPDPYTRFTIPDVTTQPTATANLDVAGLGKKTDILFVDCAPESPARRSLCYDEAARKARKKFPPKSSAEKLAKEMGVEILNEEQYKALQELGEFDLKTSSWLSTPAAIRKEGGAIFADRRFNHVFVYHNGADSYYGGRGFRGMVKL